MDIGFQKHEFITYFEVFRIYCLNYKRERERLQNQRLATITVRSVCRQGQVLFVDGERLTPQNILSLVCNQITAFSQAALIAKERLQAIADKYSDVFEDKRGTFKSAKAKLIFKEDVQAHLHKARAVPYALRPKVD